MGKQPSSAEYLQAVAAFASELTMLRHKKNLTIEALANQADISRTSVTTALGGKELPSARNVIAIASACGVDAAPMVARRDQIARMTDAPATQPKKPRSGLVRWWWIPIAVVVGAFVAGASIFAAGQLAGTAGSSETANSAVTTGQDPASTECMDDAEVVAGQTTEQFYLLEIIYSDRCQAGWARLTRYDDAAASNSITVRIYPRDAPDDTNVQTATEHDVQGVYTALLVRPTSETLLCAEGSVSVDGQEVATQPLCT